MHPLFDGEDYRVEVTLVPSDAPERDVHIPVLGDTPYLTIELTSADAPADLPAHLVRMRAGGIADTPTELGELLVALGTQLMQVRDAR